MRLQMEAASRAMAFLSSVLWRALSFIQRLPAQRTPVQATGPACPHPPAMQKRGGNRHASYEHCRQCGLRLSYVDAADRAGPSSTTAASTGIMETMSGLTRSVDHMASTMSQLAKAITASPNPPSTAAANTRIMETMSGLTQSVDQVASSMSQLADVITASANPSSTAASSTRRRSFKG